MITDATIIDMPCAIPLAGLPSKVAREDGSAQVSSRVLPLYNYSKVFKKTTLYQSFADLVGGKGLLDLELQSLGIPSDQISIREITSDPKVTGLIYEFSWSHSGQPADTKLRRLFLHPVTSMSLEEQKYNFLALLPQASGNNVLNTTGTLSSFSLLYLIKSGEVKLATEVLNKPKPLPAITPFNTSVRPPSNGKQSSGKLLSQAPAPQLKKPVPQPQPELKLIKASAAFLGTTSAFSLLLQTELPAAEAELRKTILPIQEVVRHILKYQALPSRAEQKRLRTNIALVAKMSGGIALEERSHRLVATVKDWVKSLEVAIKEKP